MEKFLSAYKDKKKIYLGDTDSYTVVQRGFTEYALVSEIKLAALLYDVVLIPAAYMWQSDPMKEVMYRIQPLILTENVLPTIRSRKETRDIKDYFERRQYETRNLKDRDVFKIPSLATEIADSGDRQEMLFLNSMNCYLHLEEKSVRDEFIELWKNDLVSSTDINAISLILYRSNIDENRYKDILYKLSNDVDYELFSRSTLIDYVMKLDISEKVKSELQERISWLYLRANARATQSDFYVSGFPDNKLVYRANVNLYMELLKNFGITAAMIRDLSIEDLLRIKYSPEYLNFVGKYRELIANVYCEQTDIVEKTINKMICRGKYERALLNRLPMVCQVSGTIFLGLLVNFFSGSGINHIALGVSGATTAGACMLKQFESVNHVLSDTSFYDFKKFVIKEEYKKKMQRYINGVIL